MIFQDPYASLNPRMTVGEIIREPMDIHNIYSTKKERENRVRELLEIVGLKPDHIRRYPHEFSGGQRQRIGIARTLALNPKFIVCDEPISALDVSMREVMKKELKEIQKKFHSTMIFITHEQEEAFYLSDRIMVMSEGSIEQLDTPKNIYDHPANQYIEDFVKAHLDQKFASLLKCTGRDTYEK